MSEHSSIDVLIAGKAIQFLEKIVKLLTWAEQTLDEMREHIAVMNTSEVERKLFTMLALLSSVHEGLASCAKIAGQPKWRDDLNATRHDDSLLFYVWKARDSDVHDALIKWSESQALFEIRIINYAKAARIVFRANAPNDEYAKSMRAAGYLLGAHDLDSMVKKLRSGFRPTPEAQAAIGVQMRYFLGELVLLPFNVRLNGKTFTVPTPGVHLGTFHQFDANKALTLALGYYKSALADLVLRLAASGVEVPLFEGV